LQSLYELRIAEQKAGKAIKALPSRVQWTQPTKPVGRRIHRNRVSLIG
jgi:hypothetical protein